MYLDDLVQLGALIRDLLGLVLRVCPSERPHLSVLFIRNHLSFTFGNTQNSWV